VQLLLAQQPRRPNDIDTTLALPGGHRVWLGYDNFANLGKRSIEGCSSIRKQS
jgi:hypothetical protein